MSGKRGKLKVKIPGKRGGEEANTEEKDWP
jgi:hypothetical protein